MQDIDLGNYIYQARKSGMGDNKIREGLLQSGWPVSSVEEAMMSKENPKQSLKIQNSKTSIRNAILAILVLGTAVTGYFAGAYYMANYQSFPLWLFEVSIPVPTFTPRPSPANLEVQRPSDTSDWKNYRNEEYGFEFKYPVSVSVGLEAKNFTWGSYDNPIGGIYIGQLVLVSVDNDVTKVAADSFLKSYNDIVSASTKSSFCTTELIVNPNAEIYTIFCTGSSGPPGGPSYDALIKGETKSFLIDGYTYGYGGQYDIDTDKMGKFKGATEIKVLLSTFRFIK